MARETVSDMIQAHYKKLHTEALFGNTSAVAARIMLRHTLRGYDNSFDKARAARDLGKLEFREGNDTWSSLLETSINLLGDARRETGPYNETSILREEGASYGMYGRLLLANALKTNNMAPVPFALIHLQVAREKLKEASSGDIHPDQYEINLIAACVMAERYGGDSGLLTLGRAALVAPLCETRFARYQAKGLSREKQIAAWKRSIARLAFAAQIVFTLEPQSEDIRQKAMDILA